MQEVTQQALTIARAMWLRRWIGLGTAWVVAVVGTVVLLRIPDRFEASAKIYVDTQTVLRPLMSGLAVQPDTNQVVAMMARTLITRPNAEKLMRGTDLDLRAGTAPEKDRIVDDLIRDIKLSGGRENLYEVTYRNASPDMARKVVQQLVTLFVESGLGGKRRDAEDARKFIDEQIKIYEQKLVDAENRVKEFKIRNLSMVGEGGQGYVARVAALSEELNKARLELRAAEESRDALKRELSGEDPILLPETPTSSSQGQGEFDGRITELNRQLDDLMRRYTDEHPDVVAVRRQLAQLEGQKREQLEARRKAASSQGAKFSASTNPVFQSIKISLSEAEANVASLRARVRELDARLAAMRSSAERAPQIEAEYTQLTRDYDVMKRNYDQLVVRRETASISEEVDSGARFAEFRVIDPPRVSPKPVFPNRLVFVPLLLLFSLAVGLFASFAVSQMAPMVQNVRALRTLTTRPVLGTVSLQLDAQRVSRERRLNVVFGAAFGLLVAMNLAWVAWIGLRATI